MRLRHLLIKMLTPIVWRISERRRLAALQEFSDTELDSGWQSLFALRKIADPKAKAELFRHCVDEFYHADLFANLLQQQARTPLNRSVFSREAILENQNSKSATLDFLAQVYVGESEINRDFLVYANTPIDPPIRQLFQSIKKDEEGHEEVSRDLLLRYADGNRWKLRLILWKKTIGHSYQRYVNFSQTLGGISLGIILTFIYFFVGFFFAPTLKNRLNLDREAQLNILRDQLAPAGSMREKKS